ncbi:MAG: hypothetical protein HZB56_21695, partial [Deltaproteobacteria bacterium]|nr:hypothetical protein [Deltaproteobacteria bacterium]
MEVRLTPAEERRLAELRAQVASQPRGFDIGAAAAAVREAAGLGTAPSGSRVLDTGALGPATPPLPVAPVSPEALTPLPADAIAPLPGAADVPPEGFDLSAPATPAAREEVVESAYDVVPAFETPSADPAPQAASPDWSSWVEAAAASA